METIKEEKKADLEQLLNSLIEKGWKPFGDEYVSVEHFEELVRFYYEDKKSCIETLRTMTSKESGLWQFVCENGMINNIYCTWDKFDGNDCPVPNQQHLDKYYEYRLIESSLKDESELEDFLLNSIKLD